MFSLTLFPGTTFFKRAIRSGLLTEEKLSEEVYHKITMHPSDVYLNVIIKLFNQSIIPRWILVMLSTAPFRFVFDRSYFPQLMTHLRRLVRRLGYRGIKPVDSR